MTQPPVRDRSGLAPAIRKLEMVSDEELAEAVCVVVEQSYGIARAQTTAPAARLLGFNRTTELVWNRFDNVVTGLLSEGRIEEAGGHLVIAPGRAD